ncbi:purine nucleoside permease [Biscogniauxia mediterranea]|nr:purine nucleoside permease [Biscogniauxia mediterranea]
MLSLWSFTAALWLTLSLAKQECVAQITPKVIIVTFFDAEGDVYLSNSNTTGTFDFGALQYRVLFASPLFPYLHCTNDGDTCLITVGEGMVNAAATTMALLTDPKLNLSKTYWLLTGIAGGAPDQVTLNSITLARFSVQGSMQHEIDAREMPAGFTTGYFPQGTDSSEDSWGNVYNTEVYELNTELRRAVAAMINTTQIVDTPKAEGYRAKYATDPRYTAGAGLPTVKNCDVVSSDTWYSGELLATSFAGRVKSWTNGTGVYCTTAQEDGAVLGALARGALESRVDFSRIIVARIVSNFDRPYPGQSAMDNLRSHHLTYDSAISNVYLAGNSIAHGLIKDWDKTYRQGIPAQNYVGDVQGSLGGEPDFGPGKKA